MEEMSTVAAVIEQLDVEGLSWLADAPMFIDREQVGAFYDATVRPETKSGSVQTSRTVLEDVTKKLEGGLEASLKLPKLLKVFPFIDAEAKAHADASVVAQRQTENQEHAEYLPIDTPQRELVRLALHYFTNLPDRTAHVSEPTFPGRGWWGDDFIRQAPRPLAFIDFPRGTTFIPSAAETPNGQVVLIFDRLAKKYAKPGEPLPPPYPGSETDVGAADDRKQDEYWDWFATRMAAKPNLASRAVEETITGGGGRVQWIDYRVPLARGQRPLHLHLSARGSYDTGTFAYNLIQRGFKHGLRMVGTLKSEPDLNVLAIYEK